MAAEGCISAGYTGTTCNLKKASCSANVVWDNCAFKNTEIIIADNDLIDKAMAATYKHCSRRCQNNEPKCGVWAFYPETLTCKLGVVRLPRRCRDNCPPYGPNPSRHVSGVYSAYTEGNPNACYGAATCVDNNPGCSKWAKAEYCKSAKSSDYMKKNCAKACGYCQPPPECRDANKYCAAWAKKSYCESYSKHQDYMKKNCGLSCNFCE